MSRALLFWFAALTLSCATTSSPAPFVSKDVRVTPLASNVWMHTSYEEIAPWGRIPTNGLVVVGTDAVVLVDTAWSDAQTAKVLAWARHTLGRPITHAVLTHAHRDKMGGVGALHDAGVETWAAPQTNLDALQRGLVPARKALAFDASHVASLPAGLVAFDPGPGHTRDNIVVAHGDVLFGGCLIRPPGAKGLGNTADADVGHWDEAVRAVARRFARATIVVPSHGPPAGAELLTHTIELVERAQIRPSP